MHRLYCLVLSFRTKKYGQKGHIFKTAIWEKIRWVTEYPLLAIEDIRPTLTDGLTLFNCTNRRKNKTKKTSGWLFWLMSKLEKSKNKKFAISVDCLILHWPQPVMHRLNKIRKKVMKKSQTDLFDERPHLVQWTTQWHIGAQQAGGKQWWAKSLKRKLRTTVFKMEMVSK